MIFTDDQFVKVGGVLLPGTFKSIEITSSALVEEIEVEGKGKKPKQATGYEDSKINIEIVLIADNKQSGHDKLETIQNLFRTKGQQKPRVFSIVNAHCAKRGISKVIFKELSSKHTNKKDELSVNLTFWEYEEITVKATKTGSSTNKKTKSGQNTIKSNNKANVTNSKAYSNYVRDYRGVPPGVIDKTSKTPAQER